MPSIEQLATEGWGLAEPKSASLEAKSDHIDDAHDSESGDPNDPRNWPRWKKDVNLAMISFHAMMTNFVGAGIIPVYATFAEMFGVSIQNISYFTSIHILFTGLVPFVLMPFSNRFGRRPVWLAATLCTIASTVGCAKSTNYASMMVCRVIGAVFLSTPICLGPPVVVEMYHEHGRSIKLGVWIALVTLGHPLGPFIMGFVAERSGWEWIYWTFAIISAVQFVLYALFSPETRYVKGSSSTTKSAWVQQYLTFKRIDATPFTFEELCRPFKMLKHLTVVIPIYSHSMIFNLSAALLTVEIPQLFAANFGFGPEQIGLQFIGIITGTIVGEIFNAVVLKGLRRRGVRKWAGAVRHVTYLVSSYLGFLCMIAGLVMFCVLLGKTKPMHYNVSPIVGIGIAGFGNQVVSNFLINYVIHMHSENASSVSVLLGFVRQTWCFIGPFWFPPMFETLGLEGCAGLLAGLVCMSALPLIWLHWGGVRSAQNP